MFVPIFDFRGSDIMRIKGYGLLTIAYLSFCFIFTKLFYRPARFIRLPFRLRVMGNFEFGKCFTSGVSCRLDVFESGHLVIGENVQLNDFCHIACAAKITIGSDVLIASRVFISDHDHTVSELGTVPARSGLTVAPVLIGDRTWIGEGAVILKGVKIGDDCVIAANSVVTKSFPTGSIIAGVPGRIIRSRQLDNINDNYPH